MGPDSISYANLNPINAAYQLKGTMDLGVDEGSLRVLFNASSESLTADVWNIFPITARLANQKLLQFKVTNNSGGNSDIDFAYLRLV